MNIIPVTAIKQCSLFNPLNIRFPFVYTGFIHLNNPGALQVGDHLASGFAISP
jgi:hypothetical protein